MLELTAADISALDRVPDIMPTRLRLDCMTGHKGDANPEDDAIAAFYEQHPYPPKPASLDAYRDTWRDESRRRSEHHLIFPRGPFRDDLDVLVAGCGTAQAARHALRRPTGRITGIDVSKTSLRRTEELKSQYDLDNLEVHRLPIEQVGELNQTFDLIVCTGVLHHLADPAAGLAALRGVLRPGGALQLMVYAPFGRHGVSMMQEYGRLLGIGTSEQEVQDLADTLVQTPIDHPITPLLRNSPDFRHADAIADALLNPRETTYSVPEIFDLVEGSGLRLGRWHRQAPYLPQCGSPATTPHARLLRDLPARSQFAAMELFRGSMVRHTVIVHRSDDPVIGDRSALTDERWEDLIPIRLPETIVVEERLPPGAAAVLINQSHTYTDLIMPIRAPEKHLLMAIDGRRSIADIAGASGTDLERMRRFFQRLWSYDQVVFDTSMVR